MTDVLAERFEAVADLHDDSDWTALARRRRWPLAATAVVAAVVATAAFAGVGGWRFVHDQRGNVNAFGTVGLNGHHYKVEVDIPRDRRGRLTLVLRNSKTKLTLSGIGCRLLLEASSYETRDGTVYFGFAAETVRAVRVGGVTTKTVESGAYRTRVWALGAPGHKRTVQALAAGGHVLTAKTPGSGETTCTG
jgi:hypothetical protein